MIYRFICHLRNFENPSDSLRLVINLSTFESARHLFQIQGNFVSPRELYRFVSDRQFARISAFFNLPRHCTEFNFFVDSYKALEE